MAIERIPFTRLRTISAAYNWPKKQLKSSIEKLELYSPEFGLELIRDGKTRHGFFPWYVALDGEWVQ